ncbi:MAG: OB-fold domain-containing protein [Myxococcota bacterium]
MPPEKTRIPAIENWFTMDDEPRLLGLHDPQSGSYFFPKDVAISAAPGYAGAELQEAPLSRRGKLWSYTTNHYQPPAPYVSAEPFEPYTVAAVELPEERMVVLGQLAPGVDPESLEVGMEMELILDTLFEDDEHEHIIWKWKPVAA